MDSQEDLAIVPPAAAKPPPRRPGAAKPPPRKTAPPPSRAAAGKISGRTNRAEDDDLEALDEVEEFEELDEVDDEISASDKTDDDETDDADDNETVDNETDDETDASRPRRSVLGRRRLISASSFSVSTFVHAALIVLMAMWVTEEEVNTGLRDIVASIMEERPEDDLMKVELEDRMEAAKEMTANVMSAAPEVGVVEGAAGGPAGGGAVGAPTLDAKMLDQLADASASLTIDSPLTGAPSSKKMVAEVPQGFVGSPRSVVDDYQEAMDRITQEIMWMLTKRKVLVVWCFDQSESMKDDQREIRDRVEKVYQELGLTRRTKDESLATAVTSFGADFAVHTAKPTGDLYEIRQAIDQVPNDPTGKEMLCMAIGKSIATHREYAARTDRQMALVVVSDESGDPESNNLLLEAAIAEAKAADCRVFVLGREAVFGYPYAHIRWVHPQTGGVHWLPIDRGPETAFVEQLQTDGFRRRYDAHSSGFGPWEQARIAQQSGGVFFMLPSLETNLVRGEKRRYELEAMRAYVPDMRSRFEVIADRDRSPMRTTIWQVINDLNPYKPEIAKIIEMRMSFPREPADFVKAARHEQQKAFVYLEYLSRAERQMEAMRAARQQETSPRWQANYDVLYAQLVAYQARIYEYGAYLEYFIQKPKVVPFTKPPNATLAHWDVALRKDTVAPEKSQPYIDRAKVMFEATMREHAGTPWAARAQIELQRGFGVELMPVYHTPSPPRRTPPGTPVMPVPKL